jgi:hypothetical protein
MASAAALIPVGISVAKVALPMLIIGAIGGAGAWYYDDFISRNKWVGVLLGVLAGIGVGAFLVFR